MSLVKWILVLGLVAGCASEQVTRARIEANEDKFCADVAKIRALEDAGVK